MSNEVINPYQTFYDASGIPLASGTITVYENLTTTLASIYSDEALTVAQSNPYTLDAYGRVVGDVKFEGKKTLLIKDSAGATVRTVDNVSTIADPGNNVKNFALLADAVASEGLTNGDAVNIAERTAGNAGGAVWDVVLSSTVTENTYNIVQCTGVSTLSLVLRVDGPINIRQWGAQGDGSNDDTGAIQNCIDYVNNVGSGIILFPAGTYNYTALTGKPGVRLIGESRQTTILDKTSASGDALTAAADLNRFGIEEIRFNNTGGGNDWCIFFDSATIRELRIVNCSIDGFLKGARFDDGLHCVIDQLYIAGKGKTTSGGIGLQIGSDAVQRGTTWNVKSVYATLFEKGLVIWTTFSSMDTIIVENATTAITTHAAGNWTNIYSSANTDFWNINDNGINIKNFREGGVTGNDFTYSDAETERRTTITPGAADTNPASSGKNFNFKFGLVRLYRNGKILIHSDGASDYAANMPTQAGMNAQLNIWSEGTDEAELKIGVPRKIDAGIGKNFYLQAGGAKAGETDTDGGDLILQGGMVTGSGRSSVRIYVAGGNASGTTDYNPADTWVFDFNKHLRPVTTAVSDIGSASTEVRYIYLVNAPVVSSDRSLKEQESELEEAEKATALQIKKGLKKYKLKSEVKESGDDAQIHFGVIAQEVQQAFIDNGLDPMKYKIIRVSEYEEGGETKTKLGVIYDQLLCFIVASI